MAKNKSLSRHDSYLPQNEIGSQSGDNEEDKFPSEFNFHLLTFILPQNYLAFKSLFVNGQSK
jgi:hypothetical protein